MSKGDLACVLAWRNHVDIRRYMLTQHEISFDEHCRWFERASQDPARKLLVFEHDRLALGFVHFTGVTRDGIADWGFYSAPGSPKGTGRKLGLAAMKFAFEEMELHKVCGQALDFNQASIQFHRMLGFCQEGRLRSQHFDGQTYHDIICFGLLRNEWLRGVRGLEENE